MTLFVPLRTALTLDALGQRYGCRPSEVMGLDPSTGRSVLFDLSVLARAVEHEQESETVGGKIDAKRAKWSPEVRRELKRQGVLH
jgi:hypothetical protein